MDEIILPLISGSLFAVIYAVNYTLERKRTFKQGLAAFAVTYAVIAAVDFVLRFFGQ